MAPVKRFRRSGPPIVTGGHRSLVMSLATEREHACESPAGPTAPHPQAVAFLAFFALLIGAAFAFLLLLHAV